jgi:hypothetical protein
MSLLIINLLKPFRGGGCYMGGCFRIFYNSMTIAAWFGRMLLVTKGAARQARVNEGKIQNRMSLSPRGFRLMGREAGFGGNDKVTGRRRPPDAALYEFSRKIGTFKMERQEEQSAGSPALPECRGCGDLPDAAEVRKLLRPGTGALRRKLARSRAQYFNFLDRF